MKSEAEITAVTIGTPEILNNQIQIEDYNPLWSSIYKDLAEAIRSVLKDQVILLDHVGSTSVLNLAAKPIIDILLAVADSADESSYVPRLEQLGYVLKIREPDWYQHRVLKLPKPKTNLHVFTSGCEEIERVLNFRNWLRNHSQDRILYEQTKRKLAQQTWKYVQNYANAKSAVIEQIMAKQNR